MIRNFDYYIKENLIRKTYPNISEAMSLFKRSKDRLKYIQVQKINKFTSPFIFENIYECMREAVQSLMALKGFKPYSHEALISFLKEFCKTKESDLNNFNRYRIMRNKIVYEAQTISVETCKESLNFLIYFMNEIEKNVKHL